MHGEPLQGWVRFRAIVHLGAASPKGSWTIQAALKLPSLILLEFLIRREYSS
jgi:hypothetical protein